MRIPVILAGLLLASRVVSAEGSAPHGGPSSSKAFLDLDQLVAEALDRNQEIQAALHQMRVLDARAVQAGSLEDPEFVYMREQMPGFRWNDALMQRFEFTQMIPFPSKLFSRRTVAEYEAEHAHHDHLERINDVIARLKDSYVELWFIQHAIALNDENERLLQQFSQVATTRFGVGTAPQQDVLKTLVELEKLQNQLITLRQQEGVTKSMMMALLNRDPDDTLGTAVLSDTLSFAADPDTLIALAMQFRPMLLHDSLGVEQGRAMLTLARRQYLPDFKIGVQYVTEPVGMFRGWSVIAGISIPFAPWTLAKASARVEEASATIERADAAYHASRDMIVATVREMYLRASSQRRQVASYRRSILPQAEQSLRASLTGYQNGTSDFLMLIDAYRTLVDLRMEALMTRMQFEQSVAELEKAVGLTGIAANRL
jgi:cobalt-zinc-cadmium efflux system outer membrane protein